MFRCGQAMDFWFASNLYHLLSTKQSLKFNHCSHWNLCEYTHTYALVSESQLQLHTYHTHFFFVLVNQFALHIEFILFSINGITFHQPQTAFCFFFSSSDYIIKTFCEFNSIRFFFPSYVWMNYMICISWIIHFECVCGEIDGNWKMRNWFLKWN